MFMRHLLLSLIFLGTLTYASAQAPAAGANWEHLKALPAGTRVHVSGDKMSRTCTIVSVDDEQLTCSKGRVVASTAHYSFPRPEVKSVKLTRYAVSTLAGIGIGGGAGGLISAVVYRKKDNSFIDLSGEAAAASTAISAILGGLICGPTDLFRGPTVYKRAK